MPQGRQKVHTARVHPERDNGEISLGLLALGGLCLCVAILGGITNEELKPILLAFAGLLLLMAGLWVLVSCFESTTYNRLTGAHTTTWDAMWVELRVQEGVKEKSQ